MGDWSELLPDLLDVIARRIEILEDFVAFGGVCNSWRAAARKENFVKSWPTVPLLMLAEEKDNDYREFYSLSRGKIWRRLPLPEAKNKMCFESRGWFLTVDGVSGEMHLLHPFSRVQIELPNQYTFPEFQLYEPGNPYGFIKRAILSASPSDTSDFVLMVLHSCCFYLGFWRPGDKSWTRIETYHWTGTNPFHGALSDVNYYDGRFYAIDYGGRIWVWDVSDPKVAHNLFSIDPELWDSLGPREFYIVESAGELLIIARDGFDIAADEESYGATNFRIIQLDLIKRGCKELTNLKERSIFIGHSGAFSVDATSFAGIIKPHRIYFTDDSIEAYHWTKSQQGGGKDMGVYDFENDKIERFDDVQSFSLICPPIWVAPSLM